MRRCGSRWHRRDRGWREPPHPYCIRPDVPTNPSDSCAQMRCARLTSEVGQEINTISIGTGGEAPSPIPNELPTDLTVPATRASTSHFSLQTKGPAGVPAGHFLLTTLRLANRRPRPVLSGRGDILLDSGDQARASQRASSMIRSSALRLIKRCEMNRSSSSESTPNWRIDNPSLGLFPPSSF